MATSPTSSTAIATRNSGEPQSPRSAERFRLTGPSLRLDPRTHAYRGDLADAALADRLFAPHYARAVIATVSDGPAAVRGEPSAHARAVSELAAGEDFCVLDNAGGWAWGYCAHDGYVGYVRESRLGEAIGPSLVVDRPAALLFAKPDIKAPVLARWPMGTRFVGEAGGDGFIAAAGGGFVHARHARPLGAHVPDPVALAEALAGTPYRWGGRGGDGIDCSGLVQRTLGLAGVQAPRDSDQQRQLGSPITAGDPLRRGDLVFLPGHVGMMADAERLVHANAFWMAVTVEPLRDVIARAGGEHAIVAVRRLG